MWKLCLCHHTKHTFCLMYICSGNLQSPNRFHCLSTASFISLFKPSFWKFPLRLFLCECQHACVEFEYGWRSGFQLPCQLWGPNSGCQAWQQGPYPLIHLAHPASAFIRSNDPFGLIRKYYAPPSFSQRLIPGFGCHLAGEESFSNHNFLGRDFMCPNYLSRETEISVPLAFQTLPSTPPHLAIFCGSALFCQLHSTPCLKFKAKDSVIKTRRK